MTNKGKQSAGNDRSNEAYRFSLNLSPQAQGLAVGGATFASLVYGIQTQYWFIASAEDLPFSFWSLCMTLIAAWVLLVVSAGPMKELLETTVLKTDEAHGLSLAPRAWRFIWYVLLNFLSFGCVYVLGWFTSATGGVLNTPYSFALVAIFAGSVLVARKWWIPVIVFLWTILVALNFADWSDAPSAIQVPKWLLLVTLIVNATITLFIWLFKVWYHHWIAVNLSAIANVEST